jgi:hypothetical protein
MAAAGSEEAFRNRRRFERQDKSPLIETSLFVSGQEHFSSAFADI